MAKPVAQQHNIHLVGGGDEFSIKQTAASLAKKLAPKNSGEFGVEIIEGAEQNQDEALKILARLDEALHTIGLFGGEKLVWLKNTTLLADNVTTRTEALKEALGDLNEQLKRGLPDGIRLLISAIGCDRRKALYKTIEKLGEVRFFESLEEGKGHSDEEIEAFIQGQLRKEGKRMDSDALELFRALVAPDLREIANELEKLVLYMGKRAEISATDIRAIVSASRRAVIWNLTDAVGARDVQGAIRALTNLLQSGEKPIGAVMMLAGQFRLMLLAKDLTQRKVLSADENNYFSFKNAYEKLPDALARHIPKTKEGKLPNAWWFFRCALAARNFTTAELIRAMELLLAANRQLVSTQLDERVVLEQTIIKIARQPVETPQPVNA